MEELELLADFVADVGIVGMELGEFVFVGVDAGEDELFFVEGCDDLPLRGSVQADVALRSSG
ncbi:MAG TPA: hypothetical protein VGI46_08645 [Candidatus Acidoferrum sp.]